MTLSHGILTSTDSTVASVEQITVRESDMAHTNIDVLRAEQLLWGDYLRLTVKNSGQVKLASYDKWDIIVSYEGNDGKSYSTWLPYTTAVPGNNEWEKARIGLNGPVEYFEPGILNPGEEMVILANLDPLPGGDTEGDVSVTTPNGVFGSIALVNPGYLRLTPESENVSLSSTQYYELVGAAAADGAPITAVTSFSGGQTGRQLLSNSNQTSRAAKFIYPLIGINEIPAGQWTFNYRCRVYSDSGTFPQSDSDVSFNADILVREPDGTLRTTIASRVAVAYFAAGDTGNWVTLSGTYDFPGYTVIGQDDYLEIDFYGQTDSGPAGGTGYMQMSIDNNNLPVNDQTRIQSP
jgi:hypothetical protein